MFRLDPALVHDAAERLRDVVAPTALRFSPALSRLVGCEVLLKLETEQHTGSFKLRGAYNTVAQLPDDARRRGVVASSAGNHGLGVAHAARALGVDATIFVPHTAPRVKKEGIAALGATVDDSARHYDHAHDLAVEFAGRTGATFVHPTAGVPLWAGAGTIAMELLAERADLATVLVCIGGGGMLGGVGGYLKAVRPEVTVLGAQSEMTDAMARSLAAGRLVEIEDRPTLADGLAGQIDAEGFAVGQAVLDGIAVVSEREVANAIAWLWKEEGVRAEGAGAVTVSALMHGRFPTLRPPVVAIVSGANIDPSRHATVLDQALASAPVSDSR